MTGFRFERMRGLGEAQEQVRRDADRDRDVAALEDALRLFVGGAPDRFRWLDPRRAARLIVEAMRP
jgi:hypothetical protein